jgi:hypothetical protein
MLAAKRLLEVRRLIGPHDVLGCARIAVARLDGDLVDMRGT